MKSAPWLVLSGTVAGFLAVLGLHKSPSAGAQSQAASHSSTRASSPVQAAPQATAGPAGTATATGTTQQYGYGELSARVTISGGHITAVTVPLRLCGLPDPPGWQRVLEHWHPLRRPLKAVTAGGAARNGCGRHMVMG